MDIKNSTEKRLVYKRYMIQYHKKHSKKYVTQKQETNKD